jgi:hypothetical protein
MESTNATSEKQVTVAVPEDRVAEFYAWYARFLDAPRWRERRRHHGWGCGHGRGGRQREERAPAEQEGEPTRDVTDVREV